MAKAAERLDFEKAALLRDVLDNLKKTLNPTRQFTRGRGVPTTVKPTEDLADLGEALGLPGPPRVMKSGINVAQNRGRHDGCHQNAN